jgi:hypothetical protein
MWEEPMDLSREATHLMNANALPTSLQVEPSVRLHVLFPTRDERGASFPPEYFGAIESWMVRAARGFTRAGLAFGAWQAPDGTIVHDETVSYYVSCPTADAPLLAQKLQALLTVLFNQQKAFVELTDVRVSDL